VLDTGGDSAKKENRVSGARVLTSDECMKIVQEREDAKKEKALQLQKRIEEREAKRGNKKNLNNKRKVLPKVQKEKLK